MNKKNERYLPEGALWRQVDNKLAISSLRNLEEAWRRGTILEAPCTMCDCTTMELSVELCDGVRGVIPKSEAAYVAEGDVKDIAVITRVGKPVQFKVVDIVKTDRGHVATLSRRAAQRECMDMYVHTLRSGDVIGARVTHLEPFGAFCDIGCGLVSLLTVDKVSVSRISHPSDRFKAGEYISAVVSSVEESGRVYLSHKELLGTWEENAEAFRAGQTVTGVVRSIEEYGVFVELTPNLAGLAELYEGAVVGHTCSAYIKSIIPERMKIKLVIIDSCGPAEPAPCRYFIDKDTTEHISHWQYSPTGSRKLVETEFEPEMSCAEEMI